MLEPVRAGPRDVLLTLSHSVLSLERASLLVTVMSLVLLACWAIPQKLDNLEMLHAEFEVSSLNSMAVREIIRQD